jgi:hypothetical protein
MTTTTTTTTSSYLGSPIDTTSATSTTSSSDLSNYSTTPIDIATSTTSSSDLSSYSTTPIDIATSTTSSSDLSNYSTTPIDITTSSQPSCVGSVTYYSTTPPTVYETTTIPFTVTVTASNVSLTTPPIYTPPPPCYQSVIVPAATTKCDHNCPFDSPNVGETLTGSAYTSTVLVTKKTPVPTVVPDTSAPPDFHITPATPQASPTPTVQSPTPLPSSQGADNGHSSGGGGGNSPAPAPGKTQGNDGSPTTLIAGDNSPPPVAAKDGQTNNGAAPSAPTTANVNGVPVIVLPSSSGVVIGGQVISVPQSGSKTTVVANGNTFTLGKSAIVGPGTTIAIAADQAGGPTPVTANGLTFQVGATQAIISGKTYAIGAGAPTTTLNIGGQTVVVGPSGVGVPGETVAPEKATAGPSMSVVTAGGVTITYDKSEAIIGSSTYRIGQGASQTVITVNGKTVSLGASGVGLASSTMPPAKITAGPSLSAVTADGVSFSVDATEVVIGSSTFRIGSGAPTETTVINGHTVSIGPSGVGLGSTTVRPPTATAGLQQSGVTSAIRERPFGSFVFLITVLLGHFLV